MLGGDMIGPYLPCGVELSPERAQRVEKTAYLLLAKHGLNDWSFVFNRRRRAMGYCYSCSKTVELSIHFVERNSDEIIIDTLLHEIAHALVGAEHGHDDVWKAKCREIGAKPERYGEANMPHGRWRARCGCCGKDFHRFRRPKRLQGWYCLSCGFELGALVWRQLARA